MKTVGTVCSVSDLDAWWVGGSTLGGRGRERDATTQSLADMTSLESQAWEGKVGRFRAVLMWKYFVSQ